MRKIYIIIFSVVATSVCAQNIKLLYNHKAYVDILGHSKDSLYSKILSEYDKYISTHSTDYKVQLERCKFIENAYYDYSEDYNPKYEEAESCAKQLVRKFPDTPEVLLYRTENLYGDSARVFLKELEDKIASHPEVWKSDSWRVYEKLAENYNNDNNMQAIRYAELAMEKNDTLDKTLFLAELYKEKAKNGKAIELLSSRLDSTQKSWELNQKGKLLLELGAPEKAIKAFRLAKRDSTGWQDSGGLAQALIENGLPSEAREYLAKEVARNTWNNSKALYKLFDYDIKYGTADSAKVSYQKLTQSDFWMDPVGIARIRLFFKAPFSSVSFSDFLRIGLLLLIIALIIIMPYLLILPIHYIGTYLKAKGMQLPASSFRWGLKHLWLAFSMWFLADFAVTAIFNYETLISIFSKQYTVEEAPSISYANARITVFFFTVLFCFTFVFLQRADFNGLWKRIRTQSIDLWRGVGLSFLLRFGLTGYLAIIRQLGWFSEGSLSISSINDDIMSINKYYHPMIGFLFVVILVPIYEEILFRGVFLSACEKHIKFFAANILQAFVFALAHQNLKLFIFYFAFGMLAGYSRNRTQSLATGISMHMTNNFVAFLAIATFQSSMS